jgi:hypothetical protein
MLKGYLSLLPVGIENEIVQAVQRQNVKKLVVKLPVLFPSSGKIYEN